MIPILRAFAWLRWRMFINALEHTGSRDAIERFSLAIDRLGPIMAAVLMIPSGLALAGLGAAAGFALARGDAASILVALPRYALLPVPIFCVIGPVLLPAGDRVNPVRLLLLPIGRGTLYLAQSAAALGDAWVALMLVLVAALPLGLLAGGAPIASLLAACAGLLLLLVVVAISSATTSLLHLVVRDRRRGELVALLFLLLIPMMSMLPGLLAGGSGERARAGHDIGRRAAASERLTAAAVQAARFYPTEMYARAVLSAHDTPRRRSGRALAGLGAAALLINGAGLLLFGRVMGSPGSSGARRGAPMRAVWKRTVPGLSGPASVIALAHLRLALRTPRGRAIMLSPLVLMFVYVVVSQRDFHELAPWGQAMDPGIAMGAFASFICLMALLPLAMNQFAVDSGGLTRTLLSPVADGEYLAGKAAGNAMVAALPAAFSLVAACLLVPGARSPWTWAGLTIGLVSIYLLVAPVAAMLSALFPRVVDLNSVGRKSNAHGLAGLLGVAAFLTSGALTAAIALAAGHWLGGPAARLAALAVWCAASMVLSRLLFVPARRLFAARRENLALF